MNNGEKTIAIVVPIVVAIIGGIFTLVPDMMSDPNSEDHASHDSQTSEEPTAVISGPRTALTDTLVTFTADKSDDPDGFIDRYQWHVNGEKISSHSFLEYTFETDGTYQIDLIVFDDDNLSGKDTMTVQALKESVESHDKSNLGDYENPESVTFTISSEETVTLTGKFRNYGTLDNYGTLRVLGWNTSANGTLVNNGLISNHGIIKFEHGGFDNHGKVENHEMLVN